MKLASLAIGQNSRSGTYTLFPPGAQNWAHSHSTGRGFWDTSWFSKLSYFGMNSRSCICTLFLPKRVEIDHIFAVRAVVSKIGAIFKIAIFGHEAWQVAKVPEMLHIYHLSIPGGRNLTYFSSIGSGFRDTGQFSKLPYLGMKLGKWPKFQKLHI